MKTIKHHRDDKLALLNQSNQTQQWIPSLRTFSSTVSFSVVTFSSSHQILSSSFDCCFVESFPSRRSKKESAKLAAVPSIRFPMSPNSKTEQGESRKLSKKDSSPVSVFLYDIVSSGLSAILNSDPGLFVTEERGDLQLVDFPLSFCHAFTLRLDFFGLSIICCAPCLTRTQTTSGAASSTIFFKICLPLFDSTSPDVTGVLISWPMLSAFLIRDPIESCMEAKLSSSSSNISPVKNFSASSSRFLKCDSSQPPSFL
mmetsp:Transcript_25256/g.53260  ORF Transcript_25256/g.53260 Transcript_25256/m.53260 type:complete len:257 (-) Transcript_25256:775-1545(-)